MLALQLFSIKSPMAHWCEKIPDWLHIEWVVFYWPTVAAAKEKKNEKTFKKEKKNDKTPQMNMSWFTPKAYLHI